MSHYENNNSVIDGPSNCGPLVTNMDILPSISRLVNTPLPERKIDGRDISSLFFDHEKQIPQQPFYYYSNRGILEGVRNGALKLIERDGGLQLYNVEVDISEEYDLSQQQPDNVKRLRSMMQEFDEKLEKEMRKVGTLN